MPDELIPLSDVADIIGGYAFKSADFSATGFPVVKIASIEPPRVNVVDGERIPVQKVGGLDKFRLNNRDIVMAMTGATIGKVGRIRSTEPSYLNQRVAKLSAKAGRNFDDFIFALVSQTGFDEEIINNSNGSAQANISTDGIGRILIPAFSPDEQLQIGRIIAALDDKIELNRRMNETLEALAQSLFKSWFVDATQSALPKGWRECSLGDVIEVKHGFAYQGEFFRDEPCPDILLTPGNFAIGGGFKEDKFKYYEGPTPDEYVLSEGDLLITMTDLSKAGDTLGYGALLPSAPDGHRFHHNQRLGKVLIQDSGIINKPFLYQILRSHEYRAEILGGATGTTVKHTSPGRIKSFKFVLPPEPLVQKFGNVAGAWHELAAHNRTESRTLAALRDALLPKLLSGELRVKEAHA